MLLFRLELNKNIDTRLLCRHNKHSALSILVKQTCGGVGAWGIVLFFSPLTRNPHFYELILIIAQDKGCITCAKRSTSLTNLFIVPISYQLYQRERLPIVSARLSFRLLHAIVRRSVLGIRWVLGFRVNARRLLIRACRNVVLLAPRCIVHIVVAISRAIVGPLGLDRLILVITLMLPSLLLRVAQVRGLQIILFLRVHVNNIVQSLLTFSGRLRVVSECVVGVRIRHRC